MTSHSQLEKWDKTYIWHPFTSQSIWEKEPTLIVKSGQGVRFKDTKGKTYIDGVSSLWVNLFGHRHPVLDSAIKKQLGFIAHSTFLGLSHPNAIVLAKELSRISPKGLTRTFYSDNGASAVEVALKMAFQYWSEKKQNRPEFISIKNSYHGDTIGSVSVGGIGNFHGKFKPLLFKTHFAMAPHCGNCRFNKTKIKNRYRCGEKIKTIPRPGQFRKETGCRWECLRDVQSILKRKKKRIAAGIIEPIVQGAGGIIVMPPGYVAGFQRLLKQNQVLMIADEVATGFVRTGTLFASEQENVRPDFLCLAKAITGGYSPLAATMTTENIYRAFKGPVKKMRTFFHGHSYTAHPLGAAVAVANLGLIRKSKLLEKSTHLAHLMKVELQALEGLSAVKEIRQAGLMAGVELKGLSGAKVCKKLLNQGVWLRPLGNTIVLMPPPIITGSDLKRIIRRLKSVILHEFKT